MLISAAAERVRPPVVAQEYLEGLSSASRPQKLRCDDGHLYAVKFHGNPYGDGRAIFVEQVVAMFGRLIGAPVADVKLVSVTAELLAPLALDFNGQPATPGVHHGSRWMDGFSDRQDFLRYTDRNRGMFAALHLLYSWLHCAGDHQLIYRNAEPHDPLSVDHSCFLPGGTGWSAQSLLGHEDAFQLDAMFTALSLTEAEYAATLDRLQAVTDEAIAEVAAIPPEWWGVTVPDRAAVAQYVARRRIKLLANFGRTG